MCVYTDIQTCVRIKMYTSISISLYMHIGMTIDKFIKIVFVNIYIYI